MVQTVRRFFNGIYRGDMMRFSEFKKLARIQRMQKSIRQAVRRTLFSIVLVWLVAILFIGYICWDNRAANGNNTYTVQVPGETASLHTGIKAPEIKFQQENITYRVTWRGDYSFQNVKFLVPRMMSEPQLTLTELRDADERVVAIRSSTKVYLDIEAYNAWHQRNMLCGLLGVMVIVGTLTVVYGIRLCRYLC